MIDLENIKEAAEMLDTALRKLAKGPLSFYLKELVGANELMIQRFSPFKVGDPVVLLKTPDLTKAFGWKSHAHLLVKGAECTVTAVELLSTGFLYYVTVDSEQPVPKSEFRFSENDLKAKG